MPVPLQYAVLKAVDNLTVYAVAYRVAPGDLGYFNTFTSALENFNAGHWYSASSNNYAIAAAKTVEAANARAAYVITIPSMTPGLYVLEWYQQLGANPAVTDTLLATTYDFPWSGLIVTEVNDVNGKVLGNGNSLLSAPGVQATIPSGQIGALQSFNNSGQTTALPATYFAPISGSAPTSTTPAIDGQLLTWPINYPVSQSFTAYNVDSTGWTQFVFTIKACSSDADSAALVTVKVTNPSAGTDGLTLINGATPSGSTSASDGSITVSGVSTDTSVTLTLTARGHALAAGNYTWELTRYSGGSGTKYLIGDGPWSAVQSVRVNPVAS